MRKGILSLFLIASLSFTLSTSVFAENNSTPAMKNLQKVYLQVIF